MLKTLSLAGAALAMGATALAPATADAQRYYGHQRAYEDAYQDGYNRGPNYYEQRGYYADRGYRNYDRGYRNDDRGYRYNDRSYRRCNNGTTGTIVGAIAGGLLGNGIAGRGDRTLGAVLGAGAGALAGNAVEKSGNRGYCR